MLKWLDWIIFWLDWILPQTACHTLPQWLFQAVSTLIYISKYFHSLIFFLSTRVSTNKDCCCCCCRGPANTTAKKRIIDMLELCRIAFRNKTVAYYFRPPFDNGNGRLSTTIVEIQKLCYQGNVTSHSSSLFSRVIGVPLDSRTLCATPSALYKNTDC